jgi:hypothetical protein
VSSPAAQILPASSKVYAMNFVPLLVHLCNTPALAMLMIARCGVTAERQHVDCWSVSSPAAPNLASIIKGVSHEFCTCCSSFVHHTLPTLAMFMNASWYGKRYQADCWSVITLAAQSLPASSKGVPHEFCTCCWFICGLHCLHWLC